MVAARTRWLIGLLAASLLVWIAISWPSVQDDAFIHLRYADQLLHRHLVSYDGVHRSFGASSLLYISLLAGLRALTASALLPRAVSTVFHVVLFSAIAFAILRCPDDMPRMARALALAYLGVLAMPSTVRWLDDGMESSLVLCFVAVLAFSISRVGARSRYSSSDVMRLLLLGMVGVFLRVEMLLLLGAGSVAIFASRRFFLSREGHAASLRLALESALPLIGGCFSAALVFILMHSLLPDTAVAKAAGLAGWRNTVVATGSVFASSMSFGLGSLALWVISLWMVGTLRTSSKLAVLAANSVFPVAFALAVLRGQAVQGIRYFDWLLAFSLFWNILELSRVGASRTGQHLRDTDGGKRPLWIVRAFATFLVCAWPVESALFYRLFADHKRSLAEFRAQHLDRLHDLPLASYDIGYIGYFTGSPVCDFAGLVNGRQFARLPPEQRTQACAASHPAMLFGNLGQLGDFNTYLNLSRWSVCASYPVNNLRRTDVHYLVAAPEHVEQVCAATGNAPQPITNLLPHPASAPS